MSKTLIKNIGTLAGILPAGKKRLCGEEMAHLETISNAWLTIEDGRIKDFGEATNGKCEAANGEYDTTIDAQGGTVLPSFCDSHTHTSSMPEAARESSLTRFGDCPTKTLPAEVEASSTLPTGCTN